MYCVFEVRRIWKMLLFNFVFLTVSLHYCLADCLYAFSKRTSGFDMAPSAATMLPGTAVPGLYLNSLLHILIPMD